MTTRREFLAATAAAAATGLIPAALDAAHSAPPRSRARAPEVNRRIVLASRPRGEPLPTDFRLESVPVPALGSGQVLLQTLWLSLDPYVRGVLDEESDDPSYATPMELGAVVVGGTVSRVLASNHPGYGAGDLVVAGSGWQEYQVRDAAGLTKLDPGMRFPQYAQSVLGMPGFTAYHGLFNIGKPTAGETLVLAASTGAVGSIVGQLGKLHGLRVVGIAGGPEK